MKRGSLVFNLFKTQGVTLSHPDTDKTTQTISISHSPSLVLLECVGDVTEGQINKSNSVGQFPKPGLSLVLDFLFSKKLLDSCLIQYS